MKNISLIGFMGSGKTESGRIAGGLLSVPFYDVDEIIEEMEGLPIPEIFMKFGERYFRKRECEVLSWALSGRGSVISCGGGAPLDPWNRYLLKERGTVIWLRCSFGEVVARLTLENRARRPLVAMSRREAMKKLFDGRETVYSFADRVIDTEGLSPHYVARRIVHVK